MSIESTRNALKKLEQKIIPKPNNIISVVQFDEEGNYNIPEGAVLNKGVLLVPESVTEDMWEKEVLEASISSKS